MAKMPKIKGLARKKPVCYDPDQKRFITIDDLIDGKATIVPLDRLNRDQIRQLVIERNRIGENYTVQTDWAAPPQTRNAVIQAIEADTESGRMAVEAEVMYLRDLLKQIEEAL